MKKFVTLLAVAFIMVGSAVFAQEISDDNSKPDMTVRVIVPKEQHTTQKTASVKLEYTPSSDEVRIYYTVMEVSFDQGEAMNTIYACLRDFQQENQYYGFTYMSKDRTRYFKDKHIKWCTYMSYVKFNR